MSVKKPDSCPKCFENRGGLRRRSGQLSLRTHVNARTGHDRISRDRRGNNRDRVVHAAYQHHQRVAAANVSVRQIPCRSSNLVEASSNA